MCINGCPYRTEAMLLDVLQCSKIYVDKDQIGGSDQHADAEYAHVRDMLQCRPEVSQVFEFAHISGWRYRYR